MGSKYNGLSIDELASVLVKSTLDLAAQATKSLSERTNSIAALSADAAQLSHSAPELASIGAAAILTLGDRAKEVATVLADVHVLTVQAESLLKLLISNDTREIIELENLVIKIEDIAQRSVDSGKSLKDALIRLDEGLNRAQFLLDPITNLMHQVNSISFA